MKNFYQILEVSENASPEVIEKAYKALAMKYHPDVYPRDKAYWAENKFKEITEAYEILSDTNLRKEYDIKIGLNLSSEDNYKKLYSENEKLKKELNNLKMDNETQKYSNGSNSSKLNPISYIKKYTNTIGNLIKNEKKKPAEERSKDFKALLLTILIVPIIIFIFWKIPFIKKFLFP